MLEGLDDLTITAKVRQKLEGYTRINGEAAPITQIELEECLFNHDGRLVLDDRKNNMTKPPTYWFISETTYGRLLKLAVIPDRESKQMILKSAHEPDINEEIFYANQGTTKAR